MKNFIKLLTLTILLPSFSIYASDNDKSASEKVITEKIEECKNHFELNEYLLGITLMQNKILKSNDISKLDITTDEGEKISLESIKNNFQYFNDNGEIKLTEEQRNDPIAVKCAKDTELLISAYISTTSSAAMIGILSNGTLFKAISVNKESFSDQ